MICDNAIDNIQPVRFKKDSPALDSSGKSFQSIFNERLIGKSGSRPPKTELTGILLPCAGRVSSALKLETLDDDVALWMNDSLRATAEKLLWEEVTARGTFNFQSGLFEVEKIFLANFEDQESISADRDLDLLSRELTQHGTLEPSLALS